MYGINNRRCGKRGCYFDNGDILLLLRNKNIRAANGKRNVVEKVLHLVSTSLDDTVAKKGQKVSLAA